MIPIRGHFEIIARKHVCFTISNLLWIKSFTSYSQNTFLEYLPILPDRCNWCNLVRFVGLLAQFSPHILYGIQVKVLLRPLQFLDALLWRIVLLEDPVLTKFYFLADVFKCCLKVILLLHYAIYFLRCTSPFSRKKKKSTP